MTERPSEYILTLSCPDQRGIVHAVSGWLTEHGCNILDSAQYGDPRTRLFFMRVHFVDEASKTDPASLREAFAQLAPRFTMDWHLHDAAVKPRVLLLVSKIGHCLNDLLYRYRSGILPVEIPAIVSNHRDFYQLAASHDIPFHHLPVTPENKEQQEARLLELVREQRVDLVVLARYMQILSARTCDALRGRLINIHHSFLPSFKGARPYQQAYDRGVKLIGATAHFVTGDLDEGPIIEQDVERVDHTLSPEALTAMGRDVESVVLGRAVTWFVQHRILLNGDKTVVFR
ncbi:formyltetrahydrofolate deformylase [Corallococcus sp. BB11-1]|uniref:formyltetrahydrofolate deformylase n=1 Tax=Corallococcus sp. BB11-1 TaxID=2996783 RepID=UPI002271C93A|nr:formyltetrahydrofolate deformylase [Corallococcus sp. BB11-1]MCY1030948.1 formyltetrahydrofolate deformylase [Corallococcus sp. BB11-1]